MAEHHFVKGELATAMSLQPIDATSWQANADRNYEANTGMFGGMTAALLLRAVIDCEQCQGEVSALTVHYVKRIAPGSDLRLCAIYIGGGSSVSHWRSELRLADQEEIMAYASVIVTRRRDSDTFSEWQKPDAPSPDTLGTFFPPDTFGERTAVKPVRGFPPVDQPDTQSLAWVREGSGREVDAVQLAYLSDVYPPRIWYASKQPRPSATITLSVYFHSSGAELAAVGDDFVLTEATGTRAVSSTVGSQARIWRADGVLLATTEQLCWFK